MTLLGVWSKNCRFYAQFEWEQWLITILLANFLKCFSPTCIRTKARIKEALLSTTILSSHWRVLLKDQWYIGLLSNPSVQNKIWNQEHIFKRPAISKLIFPWKIKHELVSVDKLWTVLLQMLSTNDNYIIMLKTIFFTW